MVQNKRKTISKAKQNLKEHIIAIYKTHPYFGYPRMRIALRKKGLSVNHKRIYRLMKELNQCAPVEYRITLAA
ncbi:IS3 family transposase [Brevibacillus brevis]|uniref:IS3 family transposase n=1 Tax=Brevibacillus brevis TaxID=1393 RepID=UPI0007D89A79